MTLQDDVVRVAKAMAGPEPADDETIGEELAKAGRTRLEAELLVLFVPLGFGRAVFAGSPNMPGMPKSLPETAKLWGEAEDRRFEVRLADIPQFRAAYDVAAEALRDNTLDRELVFAVAARGSELRAVYAGLESGHDLSTSTIGSPICLGLADLEGFDAWHASLPKHAAESGSWLAGLRAFWPWKSH